MLPVQPLVPNNTQNPPVAPVQGPQPAPVAPTPATPEEVAFKNLTSKKLEALWESKSFFGGGHGYRALSILTLGMFTLGRFIKYLASEERAEAIKGDKHVQDLEQASLDLAKAVACRDLLPKERKTGIEARGSNEAVNETEVLFRHYESALENFYSAFKARVSDLTNENDSRNFALFAEASKKLLENQLDSINENGCTVSIGANTFSYGKNTFVPLNIDKLATTKEMFDTRIFKGLVNDFANQAIALITPESYKAKRAQIHSMFNKTPLESIEQEMRQAIRSNHTNLGDLVTDSGTQEFINNHKAALETQLNTELTTVTNRLKELCGLNGNDGLVNSAWVDLDTAHRTFIDKRDAFIRLLPQGVDANDLTALLAINLADPTIVTAKEELRVAAEARAAKQTAFDALKAEMDQLAVWNGNQVVGGREHSIRCDLDPATLGQVATRKCTLLGHFYTELNKEFRTGTNSTTFNRNLHNDMHRVIGN